MSFEDAIARMDRKIQNICRQLESNIPFTGESEEVDYEGNLDEIIHKAQEWEREDSNGRE